MKVLLVSHGAGPYGAERVLLEMARRLAARKHEVVLDFPHGGPAVGMASEVQGVDVRIGDRTRLPRTFVEALGWVGSAPADALAVHRLVRRIAPDVIWVNSLYNPWAALGAHLSRSPVIWHLHERNLRGAAGWAMAAYVRAFADRIAVVSGYVARSFDRTPTLQDRIQVLHNPLVGEWSARRPPSHESFTVGYVGQLEPRKRAPDVARAIALLPERFRGLFVGDGKARAELKTAVRKSEIEHRVELLGYREDIAEQLARMHCLAIPSLREPFGLVALESMAAGVPVVAARSGALPEVLGQAALYHEPANPADLAVQLRRLEGDRSLREELTERGLDRAALFRPDAWTDKVESLLQDVSSPSRSDTSGPTTP